MSAQSEKFNWKEWIFTTDHKRIGVMYLIGSIAAFGVAGIMAILIRIEQSSLGPTLASDPTAAGDQYNQWLYFHGAAMILGFLIPGLTGFAANYFLPLMIGARDVAFPRINALSLWLFWCGIIVALLGLVIPDGPDIMWTGYPPYSLVTGGNTAFYVFTVHLLGFASILGAVNFLVTVIYMRAPGMGWNQLGMFVWSTVTAFVIQLVFVPVLAAAVTMLLFDKYLGTHFFDPSAGGDVLLYQNLFWFYSHPAVYVILLPALGILFEIVATFTKNPIFNYKAAVYGGMWGIVLISGEVWVHHLYVSGMPNWIRIGQMISTLLISLPVGLLAVSLFGTLFRGSITFALPMKYAVACLFLFLIGGLTGIPLALTALTLHLSETSFVHAHFHFIMGIFAAFSVFAGVYYWFPKMTGKMYNDKLGTIGFWLNVVGVHVTFMPLFKIGVDGMPRRYWNYEMFPQFETWHFVAMLGALMVFAGMAITIYNWVYSAFKGEICEDNPWKSKSMEWTHTVNPPGPGNFLQDVEVSADWTPYDYKK